MPVEHPLAAWFARTDRWRVDDDAQVAHVLVGLSHALSESGRDGEALAAAQRAHAVYQRTSGTPRARGDEYEIATSEQASALAELASSMA